MVNPEHLKILKQGVADWNKWRETSPHIRPDLNWARGEDNLSRVDLTGANLKGADLRRIHIHGNLLMGTDFSGADLRGATFIEVNFGAVNLSNANLEGANFNRSSLINVLADGANLSEASFIESRLLRTHFRRAQFVGTDFQRASLWDCNFEGATLRDCKIYGIAAWGLNLKNAIQANLSITRAKGLGPNAYTINYDELESPTSEPIITVDNLEVAQFIHLLLNNERLRTIIDTITSKVVLILGRFTPERKAILDAIRERLHSYNYTPVQFDFDEPTSRNFTETVTLLARMARFIIADLTDPRSIPQELQAIVPQLPSVPVKPLLHASDREYGMFPDFRDYPNVLEVYRYSTLEELISALSEEIIAQAETRVEEILARRGAR